MKSAHDRRSRGAVRSAIDERGIALPVVLMVVIVGFALASIGALAAIGSIRNAGRDTSDKSALAVAEAGAQQALFRQNNVVTTSSFPCLVQSAGGELVASSAQADGWCATQSGTVGSGSYRYRVLPDAGGGEAGERTIAIVAEGTLNGETRRIQVGAAAATGTPAFGGGQVIGLDSFKFTGNGRVDAALMTNGNLELNGNAVACGAITVGVGRGIVTTGNAGVCDSDYAQATTTLGPVDRGDVGTNNSNARLASDCSPATSPTGCDTRTGNTNQVQWNAGTRTLRLTANSTLTMGGANYDLCQLTLAGNSQLIIANGAEVRLYFDSPENCNLSSGVTQFDTAGNTKVTVTSGDPKDLAVLLTGSTSTPPRQTKVQLVGNSAILNYITIYAPRSDISIKGNASYRGAIAGKSIDVNGNGTITGVDSTLSFTTPVELLYKQTRFIECVGPLTVSDPGQGC